jgi:uncharacterized protein
MKWVVSFLAGIITALIAVFVFDLLSFQPVSPHSETPAQLSKPLARYSILSLADRKTDQSKITLEKKLSEQSSFTSYLFSYQSEGKKVTGLANIPAGKGPFPVIIQFRGYVDRETYTTGEGTKRSGEVYAKNGYITLAPDFLGYGGSAMPSNVALEERFQTYTTALDLFNAIPSLSQADASKVGIWGHSNGGHIALTVLAITGKQYPTVLWAPVSKPFPYSILYFTDELPDGGKFLRGEIARFEGIYGVDSYTYRTYIDRISAPLELHQGTLDDAVPLAWSNDLAQTLKQKGKTITYYTYEGADHNMSGAWSTVVERNLQFFQRELQ